MNPPAPRVCNARRQFFKRQDVFEMLQEIRVGAFCAAEASDPIAVDRYFDALIDRFIYEDDPLSEIARRRKSQSRASLGAISSGEDARALFERGRKLVQGL
jgi:hypothetical protein